MKISSVVTALLVSLSLLAVPACKKDKKNADDKAGETTTPATDKPADTPTAGGTTDPAAGTTTGDMAKPAEPAAGGEPTEVKKDDPAAAGAAGDAPKEGAPK
jgi:hypothetical protein